MGWRRLKSDSQRNSLWYAGSIVVYLGVKPLRKPKNVYYNPKIRKIPSPDSSHPEQATQASEQPLVNQALPAPLEVPKESNQNGGQGKKAEDLKGMGKDQDKKKTSSDPNEKAPNATAS